MADLAKDTFSGLFLRACKQFPSRIFVRQWPTEATSYADVAVKVSQLAHDLAAAGFNRGDRIVCFSENPLPTLYFLLASAMTGIVLIPVSPLFTNRYLQEILNRSGATAVYCDSTIITRLSKAGFRTLSVDEKGRLRDGDASLPPAQSSSYAKALKFLAQHDQAKPETPLVLQPTSGSTGRPKLVIRTHYSYARNASFLANELRKRWPERSAEPVERLLFVTALTHALGMSVLTTAFKLAAEIALPRGIDTSAPLSDVRDLDPTILPLTPRVLRSLEVQAVRTKTQDRPLFGPSAAVIFTGGDKSFVEILMKLHSQGIEIVEFYGSTETGFMTLTPFGKWKPGTIGKVISDVDLKIGTGGEILARTPGIMPGYYGDPEKTRKVIDAEGYYHTQDAGELDSDGYVKFLGRLRDNFKTYEGSSIFPAVIEASIEGFPWARQVFLIGDGLPYLVALIALNDPTAETSEPDGFLRPEDHPELYRKAGADLAQLNGKLERIENVILFALFNRPFAPSLYRVVSAAKVNRDRKAFSEQYAAHIQDLYSARTWPENSHLVPGADRRLRKRS